MYPGAQSTPRAVQCLTVAPLYLGLGGTFLDELVKVEGSRQLKEGNNDHAAAWCLGENTGDMLTALRAFAGLVLGPVVFVGLLYLLVVANFFQNLVESEVYDVAISDTDAYNRIYDEVLVDEVIKDETQNLLGGLDLSNDDQGATPG